ncbi:TlpA family protein disulfide reductase [Pedobacter insulae]|uniref:Thiol-disulfide isomerase or thioredoxin n=1 Tax=Pedobacter insulae TaxID=414048 RepID=A0A1I2ZUL4_9SPHI|nr:TlpA disulfide reductase family protein [Pedobacter insulae]SFH41602.1 Thiol-disulfide isomerase or thioredoxin [Pedobacter insulae]
MKKSLKIILLCILSILCFNSYGQFRLTGKIKNYAGVEKLQINIPVIYGFHKENSIDIPISKDGSFAASLSIPMQKFANIIFLRKFHTLLLSPNSNLDVVLDARDSTLKLISGKALAESKVMQGVKLEEYPFFLANDPTRTYTKYTLKQLRKEVIEPYFAQQAEKIQKVKSSAISTHDKALISTELTCIAYNYLNDFARTGISNRPLVDSLILSIFDKSDQHPSALPAGPQYYSFLDNYVRYLETKAFFTVKPNQLGKNELIPYFGITLDSANSIVKNFGKPYWRWIGSIKNLPSKVVEPYTYQQLVNLYNDKDLKLMIGLAEAFKQKFPTSNYLDDIHSKLNSLQEKLTKNIQNTSIKIVDNYEKMTSIYEVIKSLKGKVVYLDVWGTWCGPCKEELKFIPNLKTKFKGKEVAYLYLDLDEDDLDSSWRDFIKINNLEGLHLRKTRQTIIPFWKELLANTNDKAEYYPQYFIFDKEGKLVVSKAKRPSEQEELYSQIEKFLN